MYHNKHVPILYNEVVSRLVNVVNLALVHHMHLNASSSLIQSSFGGASFGILKVPQGESKLVKSGDGEKSSAEF